LLVAGRIAAFGSFFLSSRPFFDINTSRLNILTNLNRRAAPLPVGIGENRTHGSEPPLFEHLSGRWIECHNGPPFLFGLVRRAIAIIDCSKA
jgi:hypothetical protein